MNEIKKRGILIAVANLTVLFLLAGCAELDIIDRDVIDAVKKTAEAARPLTEEEEYYLGRAVAARILQQYPLLRDEELTEYVNLIGQTVALHSDMPVTYGGYHFAVLDTGEINAFACPGGMIFISRGVVEFVESEDELAAVLAHEVAHINNRDGVKAIQSSRLTNLAVVMGTEAVTSSSSKEFGRLVSIFEGSIQDVFAQVVVNGYSQSAEAKADVDGLAYLARSGYDPAALESLLARIVSVGQESRGGIMKTHPATSQRVENVASNLPGERPSAEVVQLRTGRYRETVR